MARGRWSFKQRDLARALRAAQKSGVPTQRVEIDRDGRILVILDPPQEQESTGENKPANGDEPNELDKWLADKHARKTQRT